MYREQESLLRIQPRDPFARRTFWALGASLLVSMGASVVLGGGGSMQLFAAFGAAKRIVLPFIYGAFLLVLVWPLRGKFVLIRPPVWWVFLAVLLGFSTVASLFISQTPVRVGDLVEGWALIAGFLLLSLAGMASWQWREREQQTLLWLIGGVAAIGLIANVSLGPFNNIAVPAMFGLAYSAYRVRTYRYMLLLGSVTLAVALSVQVFAHPNVSIAVVAQLVACGVLIGILVLPRMIRWFFAISALILGCLTLVRTGVLDLMMGRVPSGFDDITLTHRAYEASVVYQMLSENALLSFIGAGPAATVDLSGSPDRRTLFVAGRDLLHVDDVHFLNSWMLLKFGILGIVWLGILAFGIMQSMYKLLQHKRPPLFEAMLILFIVAGVASALPAATNLFTNPLVPLFLGILTKRQAIVGSMLSHAARPKASRSIEGTDVS